MANSPLTGYQGQIMIGAQEIIFLGSWEVTRTREVNERGPYIGDEGRIYKTLGGLNASGSLTGEVQAGSDAGRQALIDANTNGTSVVLDLIQTNGLHASGVAFINEITLGSEATDTQTIEFSFEVSGDLVIEDAA